MENNHPLLTVVVPPTIARGHERTQENTRGHERTIEACLRSIADSTCRNLDIICVDDGSNDSTQLLAEKMAETGNIGVLCGYILEYFAAVGLRNNA